jgi:O-antigen/teichoic acid export membrane protein
LVTHEPDRTQVDKSRPIWSDLGVRRYALIVLIALGAGLALDLLLIPRYGASGAAAAASAAFLAGGCGALAAFRRQSVFPWRSLLLPRRGDLAVFRALATPLRLVRSS